MALAFLALSSFARPMVIQNETLRHAPPLQKRVYSVPRIDDPGEFSRWPKTGVDAEGANEPSIFYCFESVDAANNWGDVVTAALLKWTLALHPASGLHILLHPTCNGDPHVICDKIDSTGDKFVIKDGGGRGSSMSSTRYYAFDPSPNNNYLRLNGYDVRTYDQLVLDCAHELGHIMGLQHEHQRPDRDEYLEFICDNLAGAEDARDNINEEGDAEQVFQGLDEDQRFEMVCNDFDLAGSYFEEAKSYVAFGQDDVAYSHFETDSGELDYDSIMIYSTWQLIEDPDDRGDFERAELFRYDENGEPTAIYQGGSENPVEAGPSPRDIARIINVYPKFD